jgi:glutathione S-transferase
MYVHMLAEPKLMLRYNNQGVPRWEDRAIRYGWPVMVRFARRALDIRPGVEIDDEAAVWRELEFVAEELSDGRPYLSGESFSAADLTFAALSAPVVVPRGYGVRLPEIDELPERTATLVQRAREHAAGRHALAMYAAHRRERVARAPAGDRPYKPARVS